MQINNASKEGCKSNDDTVCFKKQAGSPSMPAPVDFFNFISTVLYSTSQMAKNPRWVNGYSSWVNGSCGH